MHLLDVAKQYKNTSGIPEDLIFKRSEDGRTVVLSDGTKVSDELIEQAKRDAAKAKSAPTPAGINPEVIEGFVKQLSGLTERVTKSEATIAALQGEVAKLKGK